MAMHVDEAALRDFLIDSGLMTRAQLREVAVRTQERGVPLYETLQTAGLIGADELRRAAAHVSGIVFIELEKDDISVDALMLVPEPISRVHNIAAFRQDGRVVEVALLDFDDLPVIDFLSHETGIKIIPRLTTAASLKRALMLYHKHLKEKYGEKMKSGSDAEAATDALLAHAMLHRATDIYIEPLPVPEGREFLSSQGELLVRYRIGGTLYDAMKLPLDAIHVTRRLKEFANMSFTLPVPQEGRFTVELENGERANVGVSVMATAYGERMVLHLVPLHAHARRGGFTLPSLGFHGENLEKILSVLGNASGLVLVGGKTGGGKTTTLYTMLDVVNAPGLSVASVEEKIEYRLPHVSQSQIRPELGLTTDAMLRAILKQHPDVVMIDSVRDSKTASLAASAASRGILVFAGIEAPSAAAAVCEYMSLGVPQHLLSSTLKAAVGVSVAKKVCASCKDTYRLTRAEAAPFERSADFGRVLSILKEEKIIADEVQWKDLMFAHPLGCGACEGGYSGSIGLQEVLTVSPALKKSIEERGNGNDILKTAREGAATLAEDGLCKAAQGITSIEEVRRAIEREV